MYVGPLAWFNDQHIKPTCPYRVVLHINCSPFLGSGWRKTVPIVALWHGVFQIESYLCVCLQLLLSTEGLLLGSVLLLEIQVFWHMTSCKLVNSCRRFGVDCCFRLESSLRRVSFLNVRPASFSETSVSVTLQRFVSQRTWIFICTAVRTSNVLLRKGRLFTWYPGLRKFRTPGPPGWLNCGRWRLIFVGRQLEICFILLFWRQEFFCSS